MLLVLFLLNIFSISPEAFDVKACPEERDLNSLEVYFSMNKIPFFDVSITNSIALDYKETYNDNFSIPDVTIESTDKYNSVRFKKSLSIIFRSVRKATLKGKMKAESVQGTGGFFCEAIGNMHAINDSGNELSSLNENWQDFSISIPLYEQSDTIYFGGYFTGAGKIFFKDIQFLFDDQSTNNFINDLPPHISNESIQELNNVALDISSTRQKLNSYSQIARVLKGKKILGLGESIHGSKEIQKTKIDLIKYLIQKEKFEVIALETSMAEAERLNNFTHSKGGDARQLLTDYIYPFWQTEDILNLFIWLQQYNSTTSHPIYFIGIDMQYSGEALRNLKLNKRSSDIQSYCDSISKILRNIKNYKEQPPLQTSTDTIEMLTDIADRLKDKVQFDNEFNDSSRHYATLLWQYFKIQSGYGIMLRDKYMSENLAQAMKWLGDKRIILWAHDEHLRKFAIEEEFSEEIPEYGMLGYYIQKKIGDKYYNVSILAGKGEYTAFETLTNGVDCYKEGNTLKPPPPGSFEFILDTLKYSKYFIDLSTVNQFADNPINKKMLKRDVGVKIVDYQFSPTILYPLYDAVIYIAKSTSSNLLNSCKRN